MDWRDNRGRQDDASIILCIVSFFIRMKLKLKFLNNLTLIFLALHVKIYDPDFPRLPLQNFSLNLFELQRISFCNNPVLVTYIYIYIYHKSSPPPDEIHIEGIEDYQFLLAEQITEVEMESDDNEEVSYFFRKMFLKMIDFLVSFIPILRPKSISGARILLVIISQK